MSTPVFSEVGELLGVNGIPVNPALEFDSLVDAETNFLWLKRAARPVSLRLMAKLLLAANLQPETLRLLSEHFSRAADNTDSRNRFESLSLLNSAECPDLDLLANIPLYQLNPAAPAEEFNSDLKNLRDQWRERLKLPNSRVSEKKYEDYLRAWDLREGWSEGKYHRDAVRSMKDVVKELGQSKTSARNWYRSGFKLVTGHEFSVENWVEVMGVTQLSRLLGETVAQASGRRALRANSRRPVDDTTVSGGRNQQGNPGVVEELAAQQAPQDVQQMLLRISKLIAKGCSDQEILEDLEVEETALPAIVEFRETHET
ncbi:hypothetical protein [Rosistilla carotiformis]|nr:hypothetical protein [Rosistilla carotiformis]